MLCIKAQEWVSNNGFKLAETKIVVMHFCKGRAKHTLNIFGRTEVKFITETRFEGLIFGRRLTFKSHIEEEL